MNSKGGGVVGDRGVGVSIMGCRNSMLSSSRRRSASLRGYSGESNILGKNAEIDRSLLGVLDAIGESVESK